MQRKSADFLFRLFNLSISIGSLVPSAAIILAALTIASDHDLMMGLLIFNFGLLGLVALQYRNGRTFFLSGGFWVIINIVFYIVLKAVDLIDAGYSRELIKPLAASALFLGFFVVGRTIWPPGKWRTLPIPNHSQAAAFTPELIRFLIGGFVLFKMFNIAALQLSGAGGSTILEVSQSTQNQGAGYLFRIEGLAYASYVALLAIAYRTRRYVRSAALLTVLLLIDYLYHASRSAILILTFVHLLLYHLNVRRVNYALLLVLAPPMLFVIAFFGYVRNIELGSLDVYVSALDYFMDDLSLVFKLFMSRLDMLQQILTAFQLDAAGQLEDLNGKSYLYMWLHAIPRTLWPGKPPLTAAYLTEITHPGAFADGVNLYPSIFVEAFINFGWAGIGMMGVLVAKLTQAYERLLYSGKVAHQVLALTMLTFPMGLINEGLHSNNLAGLLYAAFLYWLWLQAGYWFVGRKFNAMFLALPTPIVIPSRQRMPMHASSARSA